MKVKQFSQSQVDVYTDRYILGPQELKMDSRVSVATENGSTASHYWQGIRPDWMSEHSQTVFGFDVLPIIGWQIVLSRILNSHLQVLVVYRPYHDKTG